MWKPLFLVFFFLFPITYTYSLWLMGISLSFAHNLMITQIDLGFLFFFILFLISKHSNRIIILRNIHFSAVRFNFTLKMHRENWLKKKFFFYCFAHKFFGCCVNSRKLVRCRAFPWLFAIVCVRRCKSVCRIFFSTIRREI
jgi:hypothetical protein